MLARLILSGKTYSEIQIKIVCKLSDKQIEPLHLRHTLHQMVNCKVKRAKFINKSVEIREQLAFAYAEQIMMVVEVFCCDAYGSMLWHLNSEAAEQYFKSWNTCIKLIYDVPRSTFTYLTKGYFAKDFVSLRIQVISRYSNFFQSC